MNKKYPMTAQECDIRDKHSKKMFIPVVAGIGTGCYLTLKATHLCYNLASTAITYWQKN